MLKELIVISSVLVGKFLRTYKAVQIYIKYFLEHVRDASKDIQMRRAGY